MTINKKSSAIVSMITPVFFNTSLLRVRYLSFDDSLDMDELKRFISWCADKLGEILHKTYTGVLLFSDTISPQYSQKLEETGFSLCGSLDNERSFTDVPIGIFYFKHNSP